MSGRRSGRVRREADLHSAPEIAAVPTATRPVANREETIMKKLLISTALVGIVISGGVAFDAVSAPEATASACWGQITQTKGKNYTGCGRAVHFNIIKNSTKKYGNTVGANAWSFEKLCYPNVTQYGMVRA